MIVVKFIKKIFTNKANNQKIITVPKAVERLIEDKVYKITVEELVERINKP